MKYLVVISLLLHSSAINSTNNCIREGEIRLIGLENTCLLAGRVHLCIESRWRAVCQHMWDRAEAIVVCQQLGYPQEGATACIDSCFGRSDELEGLYGFRCTGEEHNLTDCPANKMSQCINYGGVICSQFQQPTNTSIPEEITTPMIEQCECIIPGNEDNAITIGTVSTGAIGNIDTAFRASLGGVSAVLLLILLGTVMGWICTCLYHKRRSTGTRTDYSTADCKTEANICYDVVDRRRAVYTDNTTAKLDTETNVSYNVGMRDTSSY